MAEWLVIAAMATVVGASTQGATGMGFSLVVAPVFLAVMPPTVAMTTLLVLATLSNALMLISGRAKHVQWAELRLVMAAALPGLVCGAVVLNVVPKPVLQVVVGCATIILLIAQLSSGRASTVALQADRGTDALRAGSRSVSAAVGFLCGALTTSTGLNGPPLALWLKARGASSVETRDSLQACFLFFSVLGAPAIVFTAESGAGRPNLVAIALLFPVMLVGHYGGVTIFRRLGERSFEIALISVVAVSGLGSVVAGLVAA